jgi:O-antigen ligase
MSFFFALVFIVLVFLRPQEWLVPQLYGWPLLDGIVYASLLGLLMETKMGRISFPTRSPQIWLLAGLFFAAIFSHVPHTYFGGIMATFPEAFKITFFTLLLICVLDSERKFRMVAGVFVAMGCFMAVHALLQQSRGYGFAYQAPLWIPPIGNKPAHLRSLFFGIFADPNDLAQMLTTCIPFAFVLFRTRWMSLTTGVAVSWLLVSAVFATHSRGGQVALAGVGAVMVALVLPSRWFAFLMGGLLVGALALCPLSAGYLDQSSHDRVVFWGLANEQFKQNPLFGIGYGMFWQVASSRAAHNAYVLCYTELGIFGYWFWFGLLSLGIVGVWRTRRLMQNPEDLEGKWLRLTAGLMLAVVVGFGASAYFLSRSFVYPLFFLFAMMAAMPRIAERYFLDKAEDRDENEDEDDDETVEESLEIFEPDKHLWIQHSVVTVFSIFYIYVSIVLLNKAFYGG